MLLGLERIQSQMAQKPMLWGEVGARVRLYQVARGVDAVDAVVVAREAPARGVGAHGEHLSLLRLSLLRLQDGRNSTGRSANGGRDR